MTRISLALLALSAVIYLAEGQQPLPPLAPCDATSKYRTFDGTCNNLANSRFGQASTIFGRLIAPATYSDGVGAIRLAQSGGALPSTRLVTTTVTVNESVSDNLGSLFVMQWGQFLDHDFTNSPASRNENGGAISCCTGGRIGTFPDTSHSECLPIPIPSNDPVYGSDITCMNMVRTQYSLNLDGTVPTSREQINTLTHWIDGSEIYGSSASQALSLRDTSQGKGQLKTSTYNGRTLLPLTNTCCPGDPTNSCAQAPACFVAGDSRVREQPLLTLMHTLWVREHNRVAFALYALYGPGKTDDFYFQEARRIVIAETQHITYQEFLPVLLGPTLASKLNSVSYNSTFNPAIYNEFAAAAYRMGHSLVRSFIRLYEADGTRSRLSYFLANSFNDGSFLLKPDYIDNAIRGMMRTPAQSADECFADDLTNQLFRAPGSALGGDLISINMQRGRDHGLPSYIVARQAAIGGSLPTTFEELKTTHTADIIAYLKTVYASPADIDLYIGGVTEEPISGGMLGPTFSFIIAKQFENLKRADRFFYTYLGTPVSFTEDQLSELKKVSLARIICDNNDGTITSVQPNVFRPQTGNNLPVPCSVIKSANLSKFVSSTSSSTNVSNEIDDSTEGK